jgi:hypothetical protein
VVLAEHPSDLVRDQYLMQVSDRLRLEPASLRPRVNDLVRNPPRPAEPEPVTVPAPIQRRLDVGPMPRPGLEALRLAVHAPQLVKGRLVAPYFVNEIQREIFEGISSERPISEVIDNLNRRGEEDAGNVLSQLAVDELGREYSGPDVSAVVSQLVRSAVGLELKNIERELRDGRMTPDLAMATIRDVKERLSLLETVHGEVAEHDLREWLVERASSTSS